MASQKTNYQLVVINRVKKLRLDKGFSQRQLASLLGITDGQVGNIESLKYPHKYTLKQLKVISNYFNVPIESLFIDENSSNINLSNVIELICNYLEG